MSKRQLKLQYPKADDLAAGRFGFIDNEILRQNVAIAVQYISFLISLDAEYELGGAILNSVYKNIILFSASVAEGLISWKLHKIIGADPTLKDVCSVIELEYKELSTICENRDGLPVLATIKKKIMVPLDSTTKFNNLIKYAKKVGLFNDEFEEKATQLMKARNRIHLASLDVVDDKYSKPEIDQCFQNMKIILDRIQTFSQ